MSAARRSFRTSESLSAERVRRDLIAPFLRSKGFAEVQDHRIATGNAQSQVIDAVAPTGDRMKMRVRLCWRWGRGNDSYSAAQLRARLTGDNWTETLRDMASHETSIGITHLLVVQSDSSRVAYAALIPVDELPAIWEAQRKAYDNLIANQLMGRIRANPAINGDSPTLWLMDERTPAARSATDVIWTWLGVTDVVRLPDRHLNEVVANDDSLDDIGPIDFSALGSDGAGRVTVLKSHVKRDQRVRRSILQRATNGCERASCGEARRYSSFLDVHHILGAETSDRYWNCVALCPNCHRDAHFGPNRDPLNVELLAFAEQFRPQSGSKRRR